MLADRVRMCMPKAEILPLSDFYIDYETAADGLQRQTFDTGAELMSFISANKLNFINHCKVVALKPEVTTMYNMFRDCSKLTSVDLSNFDTSNVTSIAYVFYGCSELTSVDLSNFDTSNVTNMSSMFYGCSELTSVDLSNFDTSNVTNMGSMLRSCSSLTTIDVSNFNTSNVTTMSRMFQNCRLITVLDLSSFDTSKVTSMDYIFDYCKGIIEAWARTQADVDKFNNSRGKPSALVFVVK